MIATYQGLNTVIPRLIHDVKMERYIATAAKNKQGIALAKARLDALNSIHEPDDIYRVRGRILAEIAMERIFHRRKPRDKLLELQAKADILDQLLSMCIYPRTIHSGNR